jgi:hypothetical protein
MDRAKNIFSTILYFSAESALFSRRNRAVSSLEVDTSMNTLAHSPVQEQLSAVSVEPVIAKVADIAAAVMPSPRASAWYRLKDAIVTIYAYGLLAFGIFFPMLLAIWHMFFGPAAQ